jgi:hypothetical protein
MDPKEMEYEGVDFTGLRILSIGRIMSIEQ